MDHQPVGTTCIEAQPAAFAVRAVSSYAWYYVWFTEARLAAGVVDDH